jgi:hypothetical protein
VATSTWPPGGSDVCSKLAWLRAPLWSWERGEAARRALPPAGRHPNPALPQALGPDLRRGGRLGDARGGRARGRNAGAGGC